MASSKEMQHASRPLTQHRPSLSGNTATGLPGRQSHSRASSQSLLSTSLNHNNRITRRKSVSSSATNVAALTAALRDAEVAGAIPIANSSRRNTSSKTAAVRMVIAGSLPSPPASLPSTSGKALSVEKGEVHGSAIDDDGNDGSADEGTNKLQRARARRASDGQPLGKKSNRVEVRCETCGKGYKHSSCLTKHLWEHTPEWSYTSKLLISKHQQVQLLEAASVLVAMNGIGDVAVTPPESAKEFHSDMESASPEPFPGSDRADRQSSTDTTPPPTIDAVNFAAGPYRTKRSGSQGFSRSYQSAPSSGPFALASTPDQRDFGHRRQMSNDRRPSSSGLNNTGEEDRDLAAAVELLSCSFGSNGSSRNTVTLPEDAPPVPPLPAQYLDQATPLSHTGFLNSFPNRQPESFTRGEVRNDKADIKMDDSSAESAADDDDFDMHSRARSDEDDDGVFGRMEE